MALDFPNSPTVGQIFTGGMGSWQWDGTKWVPYGGAPGTVTSVTAGTGLTGGTITTTGTLGLSVPVSIANGGTNATTAAAACANLGALPLTGGTLTGALSGTTATFSGVLTPSGGIQGITNASAAAAGIVGQYLSNSGTAVGMTNNVYASSGSITLTPGQWLCFGTFNMQGTGAQTYFAAGISTSNGGAPASGASMSSTALGGNNTLTLPPVMQNVSSNTTIYATGLVQYTTGSMSGTGTLWAIRIR